MITNWFTSTEVMAMDLLFTPLQMPGRPKRQVSNWDSVGGSLTKSLEWST